MCPQTTVREACVWGTEYMTKWLPWALLKLSYLMCTPAVQKANWDGSGIYYELQLGLDHCMQSFILALTQLLWNLSRYQDIFWATKEDHNLSLKKYLLGLCHILSIYLQLRAKATATSLSSIFIQTAYGVYMSQALAPSPAPTCKTIDL